MPDPTETIRRQQVAAINAEPGTRKYLEAKHGEVFDTSELQEAFAVLSFLAPYVVVQVPATVMMNSHKDGSSLLDLGL